MNLSAFKTYMDPVQQLLWKREECLSILSMLHDSLNGLNFPSFTNKDLLSDILLRRASLIFCTVSSSYKLYSVDDMEPFIFLVIDEAAQLKECESVIPMQLPGLMQVILVGDECQLPAMVESRVCKRKLFDEYSYHLILFEVCNFLLPFYT